MSKLLRPPIISLDAGASWARNIVALYVPTGPRTLYNLVGEGTLNTGAASAGKFTAGPGGMGAQFTEAANESFEAASDPASPLAYGQRATFFGVVSVGALGANKAFAAVGAMDARFELRFAVDSTNGFRSCYVNSSYAEADVQSIGTPPAVDTPIAFVVRASGSSHANLRSIHTSDGRLVTGTAGVSTYDELATGRNPVTIGGGNSTGGFTGHVYQFGWANRLWGDGEIANYLADPWSFLRPRSLVERFGAAFPAPPPPPPPPPPPAAAPGAIRKARGRIYLPRSMVSRRGRI